MKMYFNFNHSDYCHSLSYWKQYLIDEQIKELELEEAERDLGSGVFFCTKHLAVGQTSDSGCGKICDDYSPRNGKNGRCKFSGYCYDTNDNKITIKNPNYETTSN